MAKKQRTSILDGKEFIKNVAYDSVVFGFSGDKLKILLLEYHNTGLFALPGGFVNRKENLDDEVKRGLYNRTGIKDIYLEQFHAFGDVARFQPEVMQKIMKANGYNISKEHWLLDRFITIAYYALINYDEVVPKPDSLSDSCTWYDVKKLPKLMLDHSRIVAKALDTLRINLDRKILGINLLPARFTMKELQNVYEAILGEKLRRTSFQRKILSLEILKRHEKQFSGKAHKAPYLYSFISSKSK